MNDDYALQIGRHILAEYARWTVDPKGQAIVIPVALEHKSDQPSWVMNVKCEMPWFVETYWENGKRKFKHWSMAEWSDHE